PDGARIAFVSNRDLNLEIYVMNANGTGQTNLTQAATEEGYPAWSPDATQLAFWTDRDGQGEIYLMNANGTAQTNLTQHIANDFQPAWTRKKK
ncbi:MAG: TolB family protein, partial [Gemmatimonadaceae bacterium]